MLFVLGLGDADESGDLGTMLKMAEPPNGRSVGLSIANNTDYCQAEHLLWTFRDQEINFYDAQVLTYFGGDCYCSWLTLTNEQARLRGLPCLAQGHTSCKGLSPDSKRGLTLVTTLWQQKTEACLNGNK